MNYVIYNKTKKILRLIDCSPTMSKLQTKDGEFILEGVANDVTQKVEFDGFDVDDQPIDPRVVDKTPEEIEATNPTLPEVPTGQRPAQITNEQWQTVQDRLNKLETRSIRTDK